MTRAIRVPDKGKKHRKKYRFSNVLVYLSPQQVPAGFCQLGSGCGHVVRTKTNGLGSIIMLLINHPMISRGHYDKHVLECRGGCVSGPEARHRPEASQMHVLERHLGVYPDLVPGLILHVHDEVPASRTKDDNGVNHSLGVDHAVHRCRMA